MPYGDHLEEGSPRGVSLEPLRKLERVRKQEHDTATHVAALRAAVAREKTARSVFVAKERKLDGARSYRAMMDAEKTRIAEALRNEEAASEEEVIDLACRMIKRTSLIFPKAGWGTKKGVRLGEPLSGATAKFAESKSPRRKPRQAPPETGSGWFRLFKRMDDDERARERERWDERQPGISVAEREVEKARSLHHSHFTPSPSAHSTAGAATASLCFERQRAHARVPAPPSPARSRAAYNTPSIEKRAGQPRASAAVPRPTPRPKGRRTPRIEIDALSRCTAESPPER